MTLSQCTGPTHLLEIIIKREQGDTIIIKREHGDTISCVLLSHANWTHTSKPRRKEGKAEGGMEGLREKEGQTTAKKGMGRRKEGQILDGYRPVRHEHHVRENRRKDWKKLKKRRTKPEQIQKQWTLKIRTVPQIPHVNCKFKFCLQFC